jgi:hypothetical protein
MSSTRKMESTSRSISTDGKRFGTGNQKARPVERTPGTGLLLGKQSLKIAGYS